MLYVLYGNDTDKVFAKANALVESLLQKKPDASLVKVSNETFEDSHLLEWVHEQGLFAQKCIVQFTRVFEDKGAKEAVLDSLKEIAESPNIFVMIEGTLDAKTLKKLEKHATKVQEFSSTEKAGKQSFNTFALTDALGERNKKQLWVLYNQALMSGSVPEELHGILFWQVKSMLLAECSGSAQASGLKPFVFNKAKRFAKNYTLPELQQLSHDLVTLYHDARRGKGEFETKLEVFLLRV